MARLDVSEIEDTTAKERNGRRHGNGVGQGGYPCLVCGKPCTDDGKAVWVWLHEGGSVLVDREEGERLNREGRGAADLGGYPIGPDCFRKHRAKLAPFVGTEVPESTLLGEGVIPWPGNRTRRKP